jgi:hypothetical protein
MKTKVAVKVMCEHPECKTVVTEFCFGNPNYPKIDYALKCFERSHADEYGHIYCAKHSSNPEAP